MRPAPLPIPVPRLALRRRLRRARRSPALWWSAAAAVAVIAAVRISAIEAEAEARRDAWGTPVEVVIATRELATGDTVTADDVTTVAWPEALVAGRVVADEPLGRLVTAPILAGEALVAGRLAPHGVSEVAARIPDGHRAVAVPVGAGGFGYDAPPLAVGDRVDLLATFDVLDGDAPPTAPVAESALVVAVDDAAVTVAVPRADAAPVAFATARGTVTLALVGAS